jgi:adenylate cyclase
MTITQSAASSILVGRITEWLNGTVIRGSDLETVVRGCCERMAAAGLPIKRIHLSFSVLHPLYRAMGFMWRRGEGVSVEGYRHSSATNTNDRWLRSPYFYLLNNNLEHLRRRILPSEPSEFPVFDDLKKENITDYLAFMKPFDPETMQGMMGSWSTDQAGGFTEGDIESLLKIQDSLAVAARMATLGTLADNMLKTYLGRDAGKRVLSGQIKRGDGETIRAAIVMGDMRNSTALAEKLGRQGYIDTLNEFFDAAAAPFAEAGGEILSYIGDGFLAVFPTERQREKSEHACQTALAAARNAVARMGALNLRRRGTKQDQIGFGIGLHIGNAMFGNVGLRDRLTFSVFGHAVNETQRLESLTKKFQVPVVASDDFAGKAGGDWKTLGREKLRGSGQQIGVMTPANLLPSEELTHSLLDQLDQYLTDAEQVVKLHRDSKRPQITTPVPAQGAAVKPAT